MATKKPTKKAVPANARGATRPQKSRPSHTTVRIDLATHGLLMKMSEDSGKSLGHVISDAVHALEHMRFHEKLNEDYRAMREDPVAWAEFVEDQDAWLLGVPLTRDNP